MKILFVDDKESWLVQVELFLEKQREDFNLETVTSAREALEMLAKDQFDVVVSDYLMPGMDGLEFLDTLRTQGNDIPFIIFTGKGREEVAMRALNLGADHYVRKGGDVEAQYKLLAQAIAKEVNLKRMNQERIDALEKVNRIMERISEIILMLDEEEKIQSWNAAALQKLGYPPHELKGKPLNELFPPERRKNIKKLIRKSGEKEQTIKEPVITKEGKEILFSGSLSAIKGKGEKVEGFTCVGRVITTQGETEKRFTRLFEEIPDGSFIVNKEGIIIKANRGFYKNIGYEKEEIEGNSIKDVNFLLPPSKEKILRNFERCKQGKTIPPFTIRMQRNDGKIRFMELTMMFIKSIGNFFQCICIIRDITPIKKADECIKGLHQWIRSLNEVKRRDVIFQKTLEVLEKLINFTHADIGLKEDKYLKFKHFKGFEVSDGEITIPLDRPSLTTKVMHSGTALLINDVTNHPDYIAYVQPLKSELIAPIKVGTKVLGVVNVESEAKNAFSEKDKRILEIIALYLGEKIKEVE